MRIPFLALTLSVIFLGVCTSVKAIGHVSPLHTLLILLGAVTAHISVNLFNEFHDYRSGLDAITHKTPFSGGSGALIDDPGSVNYVQNVAAISLCISICIGGYFAYVVGPKILLIGIFGVAIILTYTQWINRYALLCLIAPGVAFGPLMIIGTHFILTGEWSWYSLFISLVPFFLSNNLLLLNQFPDISADKSVGRRHFPIVYGLEKSIAVYAMSSIAVILILLVLVLKETSMMGYVALIPVTAQLLSVIGVIRYAEQREKLIPYMSINVVAAVITPILVGLSIVSS